MSAVMDRESFLDRRREGIGGTDTSALFGLNPWKTPLDLWNDKTGRAKYDASEAAAERMHWGNVLEAVVAKEYAERTGRRVQRINSVLQHPSCEIALANIDRAVVLPGTRARWGGNQLLGAERLLEIKTAHALAENSDEWGESGTDQVPIHYFLQTQWYMGICRVNTCDLAVLFGGQKMVIYTIEHDSDLFADMLTTADKWWSDYVRTDEPPLPGSEMEARQRWARHQEGKQIDVDSDIAQNFAALEEVRGVIRSLKDTEQKLKDMIFPAIEDAEAIYHQGKKLATYKTNRPSRITDWRTLAEYLGPPDASLIDQHTIEIQGARVLRLSRSKK